MLSSRSARLAALLLLTLLAGWTVRACRTRDGTTTLPTPTTTPSLRAPLDAAPKPSFPDE